MSIPDQARTPCRKPTSGEHLQQSEGISKRVKWSKEIMRQRSNSPVVFRQRFLKTVLREGCRMVIILWTFFFLVGGEVIEWCFRNLNVLVPNCLGSTACGQHVVIILYLGRGLSFHRTTQRFTSDCYLYPFRMNLKSCASVVLMIIRCLTLFFGIWGKPRRLSFFSTKEQDMARLLFTWEGPPQGPDW